MIKKLPYLLSLLFTASLISTSLMAVPPATGSGAWPRTEAFLKYLIGFSCMKQYVHVLTEGCADGPVETIEYLGTNAMDDDVYVVEYMHTFITFILPVRDPDGKTRHYWIERGLPIQLHIPSRFVRITSAPAHKMILYRRP